MSEFVVWHTNVVFMHFMDCLHIIYIFIKEYVSTPSDSPRNRRPSKTMVLRCLVFAMYPSDGT